MEPQAPAWELGPPASADCSTATHWRSVVHSETEDKKALGGGEVVQRHVTMVHRP